MIGLLLVAAAVAVGTYGLGWLAVPGIGLAVGLARVSRRPVWTACAAGALGWGALLSWGALGGPVAALSETLGSVLGVPAALVLVVTVAFPGLLAGSAAGLGSAVRSALDPD